MDTRDRQGLFITPMTTVSAASMSDDKKIAAIHVVLKTKEVVTFVEEVESEEEFRGIVEQFGLDAQPGRAIWGKDERDDEVYLPGQSVSYIRGVMS